MSNKRKWNSYAGLFLCTLHSEDLNKEIMNQRQTLLVEKFRTPPITIFKAPGFKG